MDASNGGSKTMAPTEWALLLFLSVLWGGSFFFAEVALNELPPITIVFCRIAFAAIALLMVTTVLGIRLPTDRRLWGSFFFLGLINNIIPFSLIVWGQTQIASGLASILNATTPLFTVVFAHFLTHDETMTVSKLCGVFAGLIGVIVMIGGDVLGGLGLNVLAQIAALGGAMAYALGAIYGRRFRDTPPLVTATAQLSASTVMMLPIVLMVDRPWSLPMPGFTTWAMLVGLAVPSTALAYIIYFRILAKAGATNILLVTFLIPVSAIGLGVMILNESLETGQIAGMALIGIGLAAIDGRPMAFLQRRYLRG